MAQSVLKLLYQAKLQFNFDSNYTVSEMNPLRQCFMMLVEWVILWLKYGFIRLWGAFSIVNNRIASPGSTDRGSCKADSEEWKTNEALRTYHLGDGVETMVKIQTSTHAFHVSNKQKKFPNRTG